MFSSLELKSFNSNLHIIDSNYGDDDDNEEEEEDDDEEEEDDNITIF